MADGGGGVMAKLTGSAAILLVSDVTLSAEWYRDKLGFTIGSIYGAPPDFAIIERNEQHIMLSKANPAQIKPHWKIVEKMWNIYFWVDDVETLYKEFIDAGANIDYSLYTAPYGVKEFGINDPDGYDIAFGEIIRDEK
jgi:uncharacterized glyoxalase superfamily protein PhnB